MDEETLNRAIKGDQEAINQLKRVVGSPERLRRLREILEKAEEEERHARACFWAELLGLKTAINANPRSGVEAIGEIWERAQTLGACEMVQVLGLRSSKLRLIRDLEGAEEELRRAWDIAGSCRQTEAPGVSSCAAYLKRRQGMLELAAGRTNAALVLLEDSLDVYGRLGCRPHDVDGDGEGNSLFARGEARFEAGDLVGGAADFSTCLERFPPTGAVWPRAHQNLAAILSRMGKEGREMAQRMLGTHRYRYRRRVETVEWATFWWVDSQLAIAQRRRRDRATKKLLEVLDCFYGLGMPYHYSGVIHDLTRVHFPVTGDMKGFLVDEAPRANSLIRDAEIGRLFAEVCDLVKICSPTRALHDELVSRLDAVLQDLRRALGRKATLPPCLVA